MGKNSTDWLDENVVLLAPCSPITKGIWIDVSHQLRQGKGNGTLCLSLVMFHTLTGATESQIDTFIEESRGAELCEVQRDSNGKIVILDRRMQKKYNDRENNRVYQQRHRNKNKRKEIIVTTESDE